MDGFLHRHVFFGDLNCPFCYAQNERLLALGRAAEVEWRGLQHMPDLPVPRAPATGRFREQLQTELARLRERAPEVTLIEPAGLPNSGPATQAVAEAVELDRAAAGALKDALYRALWQDGRDISDREVIAELATALGLPAPTYPRAARFACKRWQLEWEQGRFERRIPSLLSTHGSRVLGLQTPQTLASFLDAHIEPRIDDAVCKVDD